MVGEGQSNLSRRRVLERRTGHTCKGTGYTLLNREKGLTSNNSALINKKEINMKITRIPSIT